MGKSQITGDQREMALMPACCSGLDPGIEKGLYGKTGEIEKNMQVS